MGLDYILCSYICYQLVAEQELIEMSNLVQLWTQSIHDSSNKPFFNPVVEVTKLQQYQKPSKVFSSSYVVFLLRPLLVQVT